MKLMTAAETPPPVLIAPETRFQQNYRIAAAVNAGSDVVAVRNGRGLVELFTVGSDNTVWSFYPDPTSDTGYTGVSTGLQSGPMSAGVDDNGSIVIFTTQGLQVTYVVETNSASSRWSAPVSLQVPQPQGAVKISGVYTRQIAGQSYVAVLTKIVDVFGAVYSLSYAIWGGGTVAFQPTNVKFSSTHCVWLGQTAANAAFACVDQIIASYNIATTSVTQFPMAATFQTLSVAVASDGTGNDAIVAVHADGNAYRLTGGANHQSYSWTQLSQELTFLQIAAETNSAGGVELFAVSSDNRVYHWQPLTASPTGYSDPPIPIVTATALMAVAANDAGNIDLFSVGTAHNTLSHIFQEEESTSWVIQALKVPRHGEVEEYISYSSDVTFTDADGALLSGLPVIVHASEEARVSINGAVYFVDPHDPARVSTNAAGVLSFAQETGSLAIPALELSVPSMMAPGSSLPLPQSIVTEQRLQGTTGVDLMNAKDASGNFLLGPTFRTVATTDSLALAINHCMSLPAAVPMTRQGGSAIDLSRRIAPANEQHWQLSFNGGEVTYRALTRGEASALLAFKRASLPDAFGFFDWIEDVGDFFEGVADGVIDIVDTIVTKVGGAVQAAFTFIADGVTAVFHAVVDTVEKAFGIVEAFFNQVKVIFEKIFEWLGFLFAWKDILRTHEAIAYGINQMLGFMEGAAGGIQRIIDNGIHNIQSRIATLFDNMAQSIGGNTTIGGYRQANTTPSPELNSAVSNTVVAGAILDNLGGARIETLFREAIDRSPIDRYIAQLEQFADNTQAGAAFVSAIAYFQNLSGSIDQIFSQLLAGMLQVVQGVLQSVLSGVQALLDGLFQLIQTLIASVQATLNEEWDIPFVSQLYSFLTGSDLTTLDLISLLLAVPVTILYKASQDEAPFPDGASVDAFRRAFSAQSVLQASGLGAGHGSDERLMAVQENEISPDLLTATKAIGAFFQGTFSAFLDESVDPALKKVLSPLVLLVELAVVFASCPWLNGATTSPDCTTETGTAATLWIYLCVPFLFDVVFIAGEGIIPENANDAGAIIVFLLGCGQLAVSIVASVPASPAATANYILASLPPLSKLGLLKAVVARTGGVSVHVVAFIDVAYAIGGAISGAFSNVIPSNEPLLVNA
jgi:hypothetical protein